MQVQKYDATAGSSEEEAQEMIAATKWAVMQPMGADPDRTVETWSELLTGSDEEFAAAFCLLLKSDSPEAVMSARNRLIDLANADEYVQRVIQERVDFFLEA